MKPSSMPSIWITGKIPPVGCGPSKQKYIYMHCIYLINPGPGCLSLLAKWFSLWGEESGSINLTDLGQLTDPTLIQESKPIPHISSSICLTLTASLTCHCFQHFCNKNIAKINLCNWLDKQFNPKPNHSLVESVLISPQRLFKQKQCNMVWCR